MRPARTPRILWAELTSKCPFDCVFCSRKIRRGPGEHMPYGVFEALVAQVERPRKFLLNYSRESTVYPNLIPAIRLARSTGADVELVTALGAAGDSLIKELSLSGLTRLTVSIHGAEEARFAAIYRYGSLADVRAKLGRFLALVRCLERPPAVDLAFVAMQRNLDELAGRQP
jgi:MoaA/NifB/PqqE/SkfB family radical SAM enzyme